MYKIYNYDAYLVADLEPSLRIGFLIALLTRSIYLIGVLWIIYLYPFILIYTIAWRIFTT